jgi:acyl carrier protein
MHATSVVTPDEVRQIIVKNLRLIAPEADASALRPYDDIREMLEVDSFDFSNFLIAINVELGLEIPEQDYGQVNTIEKLSTVLFAHMRP